MGHPEATCEQDGKGVAGIRKHQSEYPYVQGAMIPLRNTVWPIAT